jgi:hypothetical protein
MARPLGLANLVWRAGESPVTAGILTTAASLFPPLVRMVSEATRIRGG